MVGVSDLPLGLLAKKRFEVAVQAGAIIVPPFGVVGLVSICRLRHLHTPLSPSLPPWPFRMLPLTAEELTS